MKNYLKFSTNDILKLSDGDFTAYFKLIQKDLQKKLDSGKNIDELLDEEDPFEAFFRALTGFEDNSDLIIAPLTLSATITVKEISTNPFLSSLRVNFEGSDRKFSDLFFKSFFAALDKSLFLDQINY